MTRRAWKSWRPASLQEAVEGCLHFAQDTRRMSVDRAADLVGESKWTLYKWMQTGAIPAKKIPGFEHACGRAFITEYLAASAHKLLVDLPSGRLPADSDVHALHEACTAAIGALLGYAQGRVDATATSDALTAAMVHLAHERSQVERHAQPELALS